ncbi:MAG TPA: flagellar hook-basal body complex protein FliE [Polyangiaceae bacterium]
MSPLEAPGIPLLSPHLGQEQKLEKASPADADAFGSLVEQALLRTNDQIQRAEHLGNEFAAGRVDDIHGTMLELSKADIELRFVGNVRNKVIDAFYELWRMQI